MKSTFVFCLVLIVSSFLANCQTLSNSSSETAEGGPISDGLQMSLTVLPSSAPEDPEFEVSIRNVSQTDFSLDLGYMLANGKTMIPKKIALLMVDETGKFRFLSLSDANAAGRLDDYVVPLRAGSSYSVRLHLNQFVSLETKEFQIKLPPGKCEIAADFVGASADRVNRDMEGMKLMKFWSGRLRSNTLTVNGSKATETGTNQVVSDFLLDCQRLKPGMTRGDLMKSFTTEGGIWTVRQQTFVYQRCPYLKVDVNFDVPNSRGFERLPTDQIKKISPPYVFLRISD